MSAEPGPAAHLAHPAAPGNPTRRTRLGLPATIRACLFDLDGVLTETATVHAAAWKETFDRFLKERAKKDGGDFRPFDSTSDYDQYVDGKPRQEGTRSFLSSRHIELPDGDPDDPPDAQTIAGLSNAKNALVLRKIREDGVEPFTGSVRYVRAVRDAGLKRAVVSSSANCADVLDAAGIVDLFDERVDGVTARTDHLQGKPAPDTYLAAAKALGVEPGAAAVFEDALSGVAAGHAGSFGFVVGVDRVGQADELRAHGADIVVRDLGDLLDGK